MRDDFIPGQHWTEERAEDAVRRMTMKLESREIRAFMGAVAAGSANGGDPGARAASGCARFIDPVAVSTPINPVNCVIRRAGRPDIDRVAALLAIGELPPLFVDEFIEGFVLVEHQDALIGCGACEVYGRSAVGRSVVTHPSARGLRLGDIIVRHITADAVASGVTDIFMLTLHAKRFFERFGYADRPLMTWDPRTHASWQVQFLLRHPEAAGTTIPMWRPTRMEDLLADMAP